jgi:glutathione S-transferase
MTNLIFHERIGLEGRRISPYSWRIRYALAHKSIEPTIVETRFTDVGRIRTLSGQDLVPIIEDDGQVVHDSWAIACHLDDHYPDHPSLFDGPAGRGAARFITIWTDTVLAPAMRRQIYADFIWCLDPGDRAYFRRSREAQVGMTLEQFSATRDAALPELVGTCLPLERILSEQPFLAGQTPAYVDYAVFSMFQWARIGSPRDILAAAPKLAAIAAWRTRMVGLHGNLGDRFAGYPKNPSGPDGRETQQENP